MNAKEQKAAVKAFADKWKGKGYEKGETHSFWIELLGRTKELVFPMQ